MKKKRSIVIFCALVLFCGIVLAAFRLECARNEKKILEEYSIDQQKTVSEILSSAGQGDASFEQQAEALIKKRIQTSASVYGCVIIDGRIVFLQDETATAAVQGKTPGQVFSGWGTPALSSEADSTFTVVPKAGQASLVSFADRKEDGHTYGVGIVSRESYVLRRYGADMSERYPLILILLTEIVLLLSVCFLLNRLESTRLQAEAFHKMAQDDRSRIEELTEKLEKYKGLELRDKQKIYPKEVVHTIIENLTEEQKACAGILRIKFAAGCRRTMETALETFIGANGDRGIACMDDEETGLILLLNTTEKDALAYRDRLLGKMPREAGAQLEFLLKPVKRREDG